MPQTPQCVIDIASKRLQQLIWERNHAYQLDYGGFDWDRWQRKTGVDKEKEMQELAAWLMDVRLENMTCAL